MMMHQQRAVKIWSVLAFICSMLAGMPTHGFVGSGGSNGAAEKAWAAYAQAQHQWQEELADFLSSRRPDLKDLIVISRDLQSALIERRSLEFRYLLATHPERILRNQGIAQFSNFQLTDEDLDALSRSSPDYAAALKRIKALRQRSDGHPQWPALRAANQSLVNENGYQTIYRQFERRVQTAGKLLEGSR
jgi:hypothetical protein